MSTSLPVMRAVRRRHVYFLSGFDPKGAAHYYALFQALALEQSSVNAMSLTVGARQRDSAGNSSWEVNAVTPEGTACKTTYEFCRWDDIVRRNWPRSVWRLLIDMWVAYARMLSSGEISTVWRLSRKTLVGLVYPLVILGGGLLTGLAMGVGVAAALRARGATSLASGAAALVSFALALWGTLKLENRLNTSWLVRIFSFSGKQACGQLPELEDRLNAVATRIAGKIRASDVDEILIVGFSVGSILAVSSVARALDASSLPGQDSNDATSDGPTISLLTLGHCIPMLGLFPQAQAFREELRVLAQASRLYWLDFSSPTDWGSFALVDPVDACRIEMKTGEKMNPAIRSPRFHTLFTPATYARIKRDKRRMHKQYLMAGELLSHYDYLALTSGALTLRQRYGASPR